MMKNDQTVRPEDVPSDDLIDHNRREVLSALSLAVAGSAIAIFPSSTQAQSDASSTPRRALTGRDGANKSVFKSSDVTPQVLRFESTSGLVFYELYATEGVPEVSGHEPDPMLTKKGSFPRPGGTLFRLVQFPPKPPEGSKPDAAAYARYLDELDQKIPGMASHFERDTPGMHTSDSVDYGVVIRGEIILELDDGKTVHLRQGDCVVQNGTRHRWHNALSKPALMAFVLIGGKRVG
jgi:mannose-6-phosphate isomerase-like protein (cupin superfamily)